MSLDLRSFPRYIYTKGTGVSVLKSQPLVLNLVQTIMFCISFDIILRFGFRPLK
jgi:hypothetical protein